MFKKILYCTDFSENSDHAFSYALNLATTYHSMLLILHVIV
jgi:nucleotide-binding universal stress UspA family protein